MVLDISNHNFRSIWLWKTVLDTLKKDFMLPFTLGNGVKYVEKIFSLLWTSENGVNLMVKLC